MDGLVAQGVPRTELKEAEDLLKELQKVKLQPLQSDMKPLSHELLALQGRIERKPKTVSEVTKLNGDVDKYEDKVEAKRLRVKEVRDALDGIKRKLQSSEKDKDMQERMKDELLKKDKELKNKLKGKEVQDVLDQVQGDIEATVRDILRINKELEKDDLPP